MTCDATPILDPEAVLHEEDPVFEDEHVQEVDEVAEVVQGEPGEEVSGRLDVGKEESERDDPCVVQKDKS